MERGCFVVLGWSGWFCVCYLFRRVLGFIVFCVVIGVFWGLWFGLVLVRSWMAFRVTI